MIKLQTIGGNQDRLQSFAQSWLNSRSYLARAQSMTHADGALVACVYRDREFQVELCCVPPGMVIPEHVHPHADTIEVLVAGVLRLSVNGRDVFAGQSDADVQRMNRWKGVRINRDDVHGTAVPVGPNGGMFFSIQMWDQFIGPQSVLTDYKGRPLGRQHDGMIKRT